MGNELNQGAKFQTKNWIFVFIIITLRFEHFLYQSFDTLIFFLKGLFWLSVYTAYIFYDNISYSRTVIRRDEQIMRLVVRTTPTQTVAVPLRAENCEYLWGIVTVPTTTLRYKAD